MEKMWPRRGGRPAVSTALQSSRRPACVCWQQAQAGCSADGRPPSRGQGRRQPLPSSQHALQATHAARMHGTRGLAVRQTPGAEAPPRKRALSPHIASYHSRPLPWPSLLRCVVDCRAPWWGSARASGGAGAGRGDTNAAATPASPGATANQRPLQPLHESVGAHQLPWPSATKSPPRPQPASSTPQATMGNGPPPAIWPSHVRATVNRGRPARPARARGELSFFSARRSVSSSSIKHSVAKICFSLSPLFRRAQVLSDFAVTLNNQRSSPPITPAYLRARFKNMLHYKA